MLERSFVSLGGLPPVRLSIGHRSCAYFGHCNRKCSGILLGSPQAGHCGLSTNHITFAWEGFTKVLGNTHDLVCVHDPVDGEDEISRALDLG